MIKQTPIKPTPCTYCGKLGHSSVMCFSKPRAPIKKAKQSRMRRETAFKSMWLQENPPRDGVWYCYLRISEWCPKVLTIDTLTLEHVEPKSGGVDKKYNLKNVRPACFWCNSLKGSRRLEALVSEFPHLSVYL